MTKPTRISDFKATSNAPQASGTSDDAPFTGDYFAQDRVELNVGPNATGFQLARMTRMNIRDDTAIGFADFIGDCVQILSDAVNLPGSIGGLYGSNAAIWLQPGASYRMVVGYNPQIITEEGSAILQRIGARLQVDGHGFGSALDAAVSVYATGSTAWKNYIVLNEDTSNAQSIAATGNFVSAPQAMTIGSMFNCPNVNVTGYILNFPNFKVTGAGVIEVGGGGTGAAPAWTTYTPTVVANTGTITTLGAVTGRSQTYGKTRLFQIEINITTNGSGGGFIRCSLPTAVGAFPHFAFGQELNMTGNLLVGHCIATGTQVAITTSTGAYPGGNGHRITISGAYEEA